MEVVKETHTMNDQETLKRFHRSQKAAMQRAREEVLCRLDAGEDSERGALYYETLDNEDLPWDEDADMTDQTTPEDMAYVEELTREINE